MKAHLRGRPGASAAIGCARQWTAESSTLTLAHAGGFHPFGQRDKPRAPLVARYCVSPAYLTEVAATDTTVGEPLPARVHGPNGRYKPHAGHWRGRHGSWSRGLSGRNPSLSYICMEAFSLVTTVARLAAVLLTGWLVTSGRAPLFMADHRCRFVGSTGACHCLRHECPPVLAARARGRTQIRYWKPLSSPHSSLSACRSYRGRHGCSDGPPSLHWRQHGRIWRLCISYGPPWSSHVVCLHRHWGYSSCRFTWQR